ncbi:TetR/AcrR family transcriptional regulator [Gilvimarinus sp. SDUM040013]|uniref:TetR/AcrR family transcriptional regulator n=1 Tax=Gilvimarinus gilvus TaxID=3058038 RepID=A0ABU4S5D3_9GAMM|nr:TetR/AcrR family transcriptional regulator [Gilvimarinus sp. SDUM040013]MDO3385465.1 TetR/AcrR family transcriptional regulator [Gilvimarinus sp. SDUM040013]MDX6851118.1 TetR/AcrR family transcriptional regulator [Gilvimarinus sp. SDUM040013]
MHVTQAAIIECADELFYQQGFTHTSFAQIAAKVGISRGNFYHHFKTKDAILDAVIERRLEKTRHMLKAWEGKSNTPAQRVRCFIKILTTNWSSIRLYGCPVGTLSTELGKLDHPQRKHAGEVFTVFKDWLVHQFVAMGQQTLAEEHALHVLAFSQGTATLASTYRDKSFVDREIERMCQWLQSLEKSPAGSHSTKGDR